MSRVRKDGVPWSGKLSRDVYEALGTYASQTGLQKTLIVEKALRHYLKHAKNQCIIIDAEEDTEDDR